MFNTVNWKQKAGFMALGSVFTIFGVLFTIGLLPSVTAQRYNFQDIVCTSLSVVDENGEARLRLNTDEYGGRVGVLGKDGKSKAYMIIDKYGGYVAAQGKDGESAATLQFEDTYKPRINIFKKGEPKASMAIDVNGNGIVAIFDKNNFRARFFDF